MTASQFKLSTQQVSSGETMQKQPETEKLSLKSSHYFSDTPEESVPTEQFVKPPPSTTKEVPATHHRPVDSIRVECGPRKENANEMRLTDKPKKYESQLREEITEDAVEELQARDSPYVEKRFETLRILVKFFRPDAADSRGSHVFSPLKLMQYWIANYAYCEQENAGLADMAVLTEIAKHVQKRQKLNLKCGVEFEFPYPQQYESKPETLESGVLDSELAFLQLDEQLEAVITAPFAEFNVALEDALNKFSSANIKSAVLEIAYAIVSVFNANSGCKRIPKAIIYYLFNKVVVKAGLERNFVELYVDLLEALSENEDFIDIFLDSDADRANFERGVEHTGNQVVNAEITARRRKNYAEFAIRNILELVFATNFEQQNAVSLISDVETDTPEQKAYKAELRLLFSINLNKLCALMALNNMIDQTFFERHFEQMCESVEDIKELAYKEHEIKVICSTATAFLKEATWKIDYHCAKQYTTPQQETTEENVQLAQQLFVDSAFHVGFLQAFLERPAAQKLEYGIPKELYELRDTARALYDAFETKVSGIIGMDELTAFYIRELKYGNQTHFVSISETYKLFAARKSALLQNTKTVAKPAPKAKISFTSDNICEFLDLLLESSMEDALRDMFGISNEDIEQTTWKTHLQRLLTLALEKGRARDAVFERLLRFLEVTKQDSVAADFLLTGQLVKPEFIPLVRSAIDFGMVRLANYLQFLCTFSGASGAQIGKELFKQLIEATEDQESDQLFADVCRREEVFNVINSLLHLDETPVSLTAARLKLEEYDLTEHLAAYCSGLELEALLSDEALAPCLQNREFYQYVLLKCVLTQGKRPAIAGLVAREKPEVSVVMQVGLALWRELCEANTELAEFLEEMIRLGACSAAELQSAFGKLPSAGPMSKLKKSEELDALWK